MGEKEEYIGKYNNFNCSSGSISFVIYFLSIILHIYIYTYMQKRCQLQKLNNRPSSCLAEIVVGRDIAI